ncbi:hypothetical protein ACFY19_21300 [Streptosporangium saharense]|uniref:hypothetical protein n=1 Tax=Streptosporangium saharense TaxID=1706840 RepID=UPI0036C270D4
MRRIEFYLDQRFTAWSSTDLDKREVIAAWADPTQHNVDEVLRWWDKRGVHPLRIYEVRELLGHGFSTQDLALEVQGRSILEHLAGGYSAAWCMSAIRWERRGRNLF